MFVMMNEPLADWTVAEVKAFFADKHTTKDFADAYAFTHNKFWWVEDNRYDYEVGTPEYKAACAVTDEWRDLMEKYEHKIFEILIREGVSIPEKGQIVVLRPFMARYGYEDRNGWWVKFDQ